MTNSKLVNNMYENFLAAVKDDPRISDKHEFAGRSMQMMLEFAYNLLDDIAAGKTGIQSWLDTKAGIISNHGD